MDKFTRQERSRIMSLVKGKNTKPEIRLGKYLCSEGIRFAKHNKNLAGSPDIYIKRYNSVIFVHGCFWHQHNNCNNHNGIPKTNTEYWLKKFNKNITRDKKVLNDLRKKGYRVRVVWECQINTSKIFVKTATNLIKWIRKPLIFLNIHNK